MKRSGFAPKRPPQREATQCTYTPRPRAVAVAVDDGKARIVVPCPKDDPARSESYLRRVAALQCAHCGRLGPSQAAHADQGKGMSIKASDYDTFPLCADRPGRTGCHTLVGATGLISKTHRRLLEERYVAQTRKTLGAPQ